MGALSSEFMVTFPPERIAYRILKSGYRILLGNPRMQILMPSSTPLQVSWCMMRGGSRRTRILQERSLCHLSLRWYRVLQRHWMAREEQGSCQRHCCRGHEVHLHLCSAGPSLGRPPWPAHYCAQGGGQEEEEGWRQDCVFRLPCLPGGADDHPLLLRAPLRALPCAQHPQEARRG